MMKTFVPASPGNYAPISVFQQAVRLINASVVKDFNYWRTAKPASNPRNTIGI